MEYSTYVVGIVAFTSVIWLIFSFFAHEEKKEEKKETRRTCRLCGDRMEFMCQECDNGWCKYDFEEERDKEYLDYYFVNSISRHCKKCRAPELIVTASKLKKPVCFSCIEDCEKNDCKKHDAFINAYVDAHFANIMRNLTSTKIPGIQIGTASVFFV